MQAAVAVLSAYLAALVALRLLGRLLRTASVWRLADALTPRILHRVVALGAGIAIGVPAAARADSSEAPVVMHRLPDAPPTDATMSTTTSTPPLSTATAPVTQFPPPQPDPPASSWWHVQAGDNFWSIAVQTLRTTWSRNPSVGEVAPYWSRVIDENRSRLRTPANPNLVYPGQTFELPPVPPA